MLVLAPIGPDGTAGTGDPVRRHAVRLDRDPIIHDDPLSPLPVVLELHWDAADALPVPLPVAERAADGSARIVAVALANVVLADHGGTIGSDPLDPPQVPADRTYRPRLRHAGLAWAEPPVPGAPAAAHPRTRTARCPSSTWTTARAPGCLAPTCSAAAAWTRTSWSRPSPDSPAGCGSGMASRAADPRPGRR